MSVAVRFTRREEERALPILLRHSPGMVLRDRTYVLSEEAVSALRDGGIRFVELGGDARPPVTERSSLHAYGMHAAFSANSSRSSRRNCGRKRS